MYMPTPSSVVVAVGTMAHEGTLWGDIGFSIMRIMVGWAIAALIALPIGICCANSQKFKAIFQPVMEFSRYLPVTALVPLTIIYCGIGEGQKFTIIFLGTFFQLVLMIQDAVTGVDKNLLNAGKTLGTTGIKNYYLILFPASLPGILDAFRMTIGWAWTYLIVAEMISADSGIGYMILRAQRFVATDQVFAGLILIGAIGLATDLILRLLTKLIVPWYERLGD
jgi:NitT/TauT family transport system permease protein